jgi:hypothetical protein
MRAEDLLVGPRGRYLCWALTELLYQDLPEADAVASEVACTVDKLASTSDVAGVVFAALTSSVDRAAYWQQPLDDIEVDLADDEVTPLLRPIADFLAGQPDLEWWAEPITPDQRYIWFYGGQRGTADLDERPHFTGAVQVLQDWRKEAVRELSSTWWVPPMGIATGPTTRVAPDRGPLGLWLVEDSYGYDRASVYPVRYDRSPRIYEVGSADNWHDLVTRYPIDVTRARRSIWLDWSGHDGTWLLPDWTLVARDYDAVHVNVLGYLVTSGRVIQIDRESAATTLTGWSPGETYWLNDGLIASEQPAQWTADHDGSWRTVD